MKKIISLIFVIGLLLFNTTTVYAKVFTLQDVNNEFKNSSAAALLSLESKIVEDNVLNIYSEDLSIMSFNYHDNYLEYSNSEAITKENVDKEMLKSIVIVGVLETI